MNDNEKYIEEFVNDIPFDAPNEKHRDELKNQLLNSFPKHRLQPTVHAVPMWSTIMKSRISKLAAAAVIIIAVLIGLNIIDFIPHSGSIALGEVIKKVEMVKAFAYKVSMTMIGMPGTRADETLHMEIKAWISKEHGMRMDSVVKGKLTTSSYISITDGEIITIAPEEKKYMRMTLTDDIFEKAQKDNGDPRALLKKFQEHEYTELGRTMIDGVEVEGFESAFPAVEAITEDAVARLWIDVDTKLPVRMNIKASEGAKSIDMTIEEFQWDTEVDSAIFVADIPQGYELIMNADMRGTTSDEGIVEGLAFFADLSGGRYPKTLSTVSVMQEIGDILRAKYGNRKPPPPSKEQMQKLVKLQLGCTFFAQAARDSEKDMAYYGQEVGPDDTNKVLLRWKLDNGQYRVIFGDLTTKDVSAQQLAEIEKTLLEQ
jgi:hypothetical protein